MKSVLKIHSYFRLFSSFAVMAAASVWQGCAPTKSVTISTTPDRAHLTIFKVGVGGDQSPLMDQPDLVSTANVTLDFSNQVHYRVEAHRALCVPTTSTEILMDQTSSYNIPLTQYKQNVTALVNMPVKLGDVWQLKPTPIQTVATIDPAEPASVYIDQPQLVTANKKQDVDFPSFNTSPTEGLIVYEQLQVDHSSATNYSSRLFKLPLTPGENPTQLTLGRKQQRFPAFDFSGSSIVFDSNDDSRTDSPFEFKVAENEASISHLEHDADTLEYAFSIAKDNIAFAEYAANATEPSIEAASRDGSGPTQRATGLSPQISPDGNTILYIHKPETGGKYRISTVNTRGPIVPHEVVQNDDVDYFDPHWSPDGALIVFCSPSRGTDLPDDARKQPNPNDRDAENEHSFIWLVTADGQHSIRLTRNESFDSNPVFDRNGRSIYFRSNRGGVWNIWKLTLTDAAFAKLSVNPPAQ